MVEKYLFNAGHARVLSEKSHDRLQEIFILICKEAAKGETTLRLHEEEKDGRDHNLRRLLEGLGYNLNSSGASGSALVIYW